MTTVAKLRQADNKTITEGILVEKKLEIRDYNRKDKAGNTFVDKGITGTIEVRTGDNETHTIKLFSHKTKADGGENGIYKGYVTIMEEAVSQADVAQGKGEIATNVSVQGGLELNEYYDKTKVYRQNPEIKGLFVNRLDGEPSNKATFDVEIIVKSATEETDKEDNLTGRAILHAIIPLYNKVVPMTFVVDTAGAQYVLDNFESGKSANIWGKMTNFRKVTQIEKEGGFGESAYDEKVETLRELLVTGGKVYDEDSNQNFDKKLLKEALQAREVYLAELKTKAEQKADDTKADGFSGAPTGADVKKSAPSVNIDDLFEGM